MTDPTIYVVDDDPAVRDSTAVLLRLRGLQTKMFSSAEEFLSDYRDDGCGCLLLDLKMPGMGGLALQQMLAQINFALPVIVVTAHGDVATVRRVLKAGALDFLEKPVDNELLLEVIRHALAFDARRRLSAEIQNDQTRRLSRLTGRERQVMDQLVAGKQYREIGRQLGISPRTVEVYKGRMMEKLQVLSLAELIRFALGAAPAVLGKPRGRD